MEILQTISGFKRRREDRYLDEELDNYFNQTNEGKMEEDYAKKEMKAKAGKKVKIGKGNFFHSPTACFNHLLTRYISCGESLHSREA